MKKRFTVYDSKAEAWLDPFYALATGAAIRMFETASNQPDHDFNKYAADYTLFEIGTFDPQTGEETILPAKLNLGNALTLKSPAPLAVPDLDDPS